MYALQLEGKEEGRCYDRGTASEAICRTYDTAAQYSNAYSLKGGKLDTMAGRRDKYLTIRLSDGGLEIES